MLHVPNVHFAPVISSAMGIPNLMIELGETDEEVGALVRGARKLGADALITGALASDYQSQKINMECEPLGIRVFSPLWHKDQKMLLREIVRAGFEVVIVAVSAEGLSEKWLGRTIDIDSVDELESISERFGLQIAGEGGEFETFVLDGPNFSRKLEIVSCRKTWRRDSGILKIDALRLIEK